MTQMEAITCESLRKNVFFSAYLHISTPSTARCDRHQYLVIVVARGAPPQSATQFECSVQLAHAHHLASACDIRMYDSNCAWRLMSQCVRFTKRNCHAHTRRSEICQALLAYVHMDECGSVLTCVSTDARARLSSGRCRNQAFNAMVHTTYVYMCVHTRVCKARAEQSNGIWCFKTLGPVTFRFHLINIHTLHGSHISSVTGWLP